MNWLWHWEDRNIFKYGEYVVTKSKILSPNLTWQHGMNNWCFSVSHSSTRTPHFRLLFCLFSLYNNTTYSIAYTGYNVKDPKRTQTQAIFNSAIVRVWLIVAPPSSVHWVTYVQWVKPQSLFKIHIHILVTEYGQWYTTLYTLTKPHGLDSLTLQTEYFLDSFFLAISI